MTKKQWAKNITLILIGSLLLSTAYAVFMLPVRIAGGGVSGIAAIIYFLTGGENGGFPPGIATLLLNIPLFIWAFRGVGKRFFILSVIGMLMYTSTIELVMFLEKTWNITEFLGIGQSSPDMMLCVLYAAILSGIGLGLIVRAGSSSGGSGLFAYVINHKRPHISVGRAILVFDLVVIIANSIANQDFSLALYALVTLFITAQIMDAVVDGFKECKAFYIISNNYIEIAQGVLHGMNRGATNIPIRGMYTNEEKHMLLVLVSKGQQAELRGIIKQIDPRAFMFTVPAKEVLGEGFLPLDPKEKPVGADPLGSPKKTKGG